MPNSPVCTESTLETNAACFRLPVDNHDRKAVRLISNAAELAALGGTNYTTDFPALMVAACAWRKWSRDLREAVETYIDARNALSAGGSLPNSMAGWEEVVKCLRNYSDDDLDAMLGALKCRLGYHETIT